MVDQEQASTITSSFGKSRGVSAGKGGPPANVVYQATGDHGAPTYREGLPHLDANPMSDRIPMVVEEGPIAFGTSSLDKPRDDGLAPPLMAKRNGQGTGNGPTGYVAIPEEPEVYQGHGSNVGPMGSLRAGNGNEAGGVPFMEVAAPLEASDGHHGFSSPRGDGADNLVVSGGIEDEFEYGTVRTHPRSAGPEGVVEADGFALRGREGGNMAEPFQGVTPALRTPGGGSSQVFAAVDEDEVARTLRVGPASIDQGGPGDTVQVVPVGQEAFRVSDRFAQYDAGLPTLRAEGGDLQGGSEALVDVGNYHQRDRVHGSLAPALDATGDSPSDTPMTWSDEAEASGDDDPLLPEGLDSHRYRCCGNGVVANVAEFVGARLAMEFAP